MDSVHIEPSDGSELSCEIRGNVQICGRNVFFKINKGFGELFSMHERKLFEITFHTNRNDRNVFQLQHQALKYLKDHELYDILFKNERYFVPEVSCTSKYKLRY